MSTYLNLIGRTQELFVEDIKHWDEKLKAIINSSKFLVLGGAGSIGQAVVKEIFNRNRRRRKHLYTRNRHDVARKCGSFSNSNAKII